MKIDTPDFRLMRTQRRRRCDKWAEAGQEPSLADAMSDPVVHLVMRRDGLTPSDVWPVLERARQAVQARTGQRQVAAGSEPRSEGHPQPPQPKLPLCWQWQFSRRQLETIIMPTASRHVDDARPMTASDACLAIERKLAALNGYLRVGCIGRTYSDTLIVEIVDRSGERVIDVEVDRNTGKTIRCN